MDDLVRQARAELLARMAKHVHTLQMPLHLSGELLTPQQELAELQLIHEGIYTLREQMGLRYQLYRCGSCGCMEGEHHASAPGCHPGTRVVRPPGWVPGKDETRPVEILPATLDPCPIAGCVFFQVPGTGFCAQHRPKGN